VVRDLKYGVGRNHLPSGKFAANAAWLALNLIAHNLARWTSRIGLGETLMTTKTLRTRYLDLPGRLTRSARKLHLHLPTRWPGRASSCWRWTGCAACRSQPDLHGPPSWLQPSRPGYGSLRSQTPTRPSVPGQASSEASRRLLASHGAPSRLDPNPRTPKIPAEETETVDPG
jgi:Transposase DDE domain group 1